MARISPFSKIASRPPSLSWRRTLTLIAVVALAYATAWLVVADLGNLSHPPAHDDFLIGQTLATALIPLSILIGFGWRRDWRGVTTLTALFLAALLTWLWLK